jgi:UDP-GlcNAc3NAcA epimerase
MLKHKKILWVVGCRPNFIKMFRHDNQVVVHTGQHYSANMSDVFFKKMDIPKPKYNLGCKKLGEMMDKIFPVLITEKPDYVLVVGDTNSGVAGALAAGYLYIPVIHLEAGMRTWDRNMPEEINRVLIDDLSSIFLCSSDNAAKNLEKTGKIFNVFNVGSNICDAVITECPTQEVKGYPKDTYRILTLHRQNNVDNKEVLKGILEALEESNEYFVWPMHPRAAKRIKEFKLKVPKNIKVIDPLDHKKMIHLMAFAKQIITDSGGMQVEAYFLRKPCITIRKETEWVETVNEKWNIVTGYLKEDILKAIKEHLPSPGQHNNCSYGMGDANQKIKVILENL